VSLAHRLLHGVRELLLQARQPLTVRADTGPLHTGQHLGGRQLQVAQHLRGADLLQALLEGDAQVEDGAGLDHQRVRLGLLVHPQRELSVRFGRGAQLAAQVLHGQRVEREGAAARLVEVGGKRGVRPHAVHAPAVLGEDPHQGLGVVHDLSPAGVGEPGGERLVVGLGQLRGVEPHGGAGRGGQRYLAHAAAAQLPHVDRGHAQRAGPVLGQPWAEGAGLHQGAVDLDALGHGGRFVLRGVARVHGEEAVAEVLVAELQRVQDDGQRVPVVRGA
jgi:hypothetical protein